MRKYLLLLVLVLCLAGCQTASNDPGGSQDVTLPDELSSLYSTEQIQTAYDAFTSKFPQATVNEIEFEREGGRWEFRIEGYAGDTEYKLVLDAETMDVLREKQEHDPGEYGEISADRLGDINPLIEQALADAGSDYRIDEWELEVKHGGLLLKVEVRNDAGNEIEYLFDFDSGELIERR